MLPPDFTDVASVSKTLTAIGVLQSLAKHGLTINSNISPYIYDDWVRGQNIETITFKDLLTHKSGFRADCGGSNTTYSVLKTIIANGVHLADKMVASYNNCNFALFRELLSPMEGNAIGNLPDLLRAAASADFYINYMNQNVFAPVGIQTRACMPTNDPVFAMLSYPFPAGLTNGTDWGDWTLACGGGGWVLSLGELFQVVSDLATGNVLLTNAEKMEMNSPNCLGWDCSVRNDCPDPYVCKNGALFNGNIAIWTYLGIFKCTVPVIVIVNSFLPSPYRPIDANGNSIPNNGDIIGLVKDAYNGASVPGAPKPCP